VADDGVGMREDGRRSGLANLRERAQQLGGTFTIGTGPNGGTIAVWSVSARLGAPGDTQETHDVQDVHDIRNGTIGGAEEAVSP